jgi:hypothetical protein
MDSTRSRIGSFVLTTEQELAVESDRLERSAEVGGKVIIMGRRLGWIGGGS